ncbi:di/tricarboxylate transporter [Saccharopolyspora lacisalsi]|uniref:Di/tricarboxylate transporter n=1 Tax=Halosaccharopolyspora lacisalsi TaxID=1000566 RepID=A0A839DTW3_9PSEU|nr:SLC13 family permease [Halosaccharopolyspora lacisalsi]MBA8824199.1 di/tricarboxylate transporter [Halosaccharopolyspora lacisalsi]
MSLEVVSIIVFIVVFLLATMISINMGVLALIAAFVLGTVALHQSAEEIFAGFPGDLFVTLVGVTFLFAIAKSNGTVDWLVRAGVRAVGGRVAAIPWVMFLVSAVLSAVGAVVPAAVAIMAPVGISFARKHGINPLLMGLMIITGTTAGGFSPISIFGTITNGVVERNDLPSSPLTLFLATFLYNAALAVIAYFLFGGRKLMHASASAVEARRSAEPVAVAEPAHASSGGGPSSGDASSPGGALGSSSSSAEAGDVGEDHDEDPAERLDLNRALTVVGLLGLTVGALFFGLNVGAVALIVGALLTMVSPKSAQGAVNGVSWSTVLLVCGIVTYVSVLQNIGTIDFLGEQVSQLGIPLLAALLICLIGGAVSAFASTTGILGALIPLAVPFLLGGEIGAVGLIAALAISSSVVDSSPFSTSGALVTANAPEDMRDMVFRRLMAWGLSLILLAPLSTWLILVLPGWL